MYDIKVKEKQKGTIKTINKSLIATQKIKENVLKGKDISNDLKTDNKENNETDFATNKVENSLISIKNKSINTFNKYGKKSALETRDNILKAKSRINNFKSKQAEKKLKEKAADTTKNTIKRLGKNIKNTANTTTKAIKTSKNAAKTIEKTTKAQIKIAQKTAKAIKETAKAAAKATKVTIKALIHIIKSIIAATKALVSAIIAGGWLAVIIIIVICMIALICSSVFGIFFSNEKGVGNRTMSSVIAEINMEFNNKLTEIQNTNPHDDYEINSNKAEWKDIISVYAVMITGGKEQADVITLDDKKIQKLKDIFWEMNIINYRVEDIEKDVEIINDDGSTTTEKQVRKTLYIDITNVSVEEMANRYNFNKNQREQLSEIMKEEYASLWSGVLYGSTTGSTDIVEVARSQLGNVGGQPYWSWYGFSSRVSWCACFVSWCADQCGYIQAGIIPKFAGCQLEGVNWFKACGLWQEGGYTPKPGDIIFFDWNESKDGFSDHVGIVEKVENGRVYTIEGNSSNACRQRDYNINSSEIQGYGTPMY